MSGFGLGRSNSLSINTGGGGSLFGGNANTGNTQQQSGGLFGNTGTGAAPPQPQTGGLFGGGAAAAPASTQPASGGLFGNLNKPAATGTTGGSLFGGALGGNTQTQQNTGASGTTGGLFGNLGGGQQQQQQQAKPSLFGGSTTQQTTSTPSLFGGGGGTNTQQNQQNTTPSLFGSTTTQNQPQQQQQQQQGGTLFGGGMSTQNTTTGFGAANQSTQSALQINGIDQIRPHHRFNDLHPDMQKVIQDLDDSFQQKMKLGDDIRSILPAQADRVHSITPDVDLIEQLLSTVELGIDNDSQSISRLRELVAHDNSEKELVQRALTNQRVPQEYHFRNVARGNLGTKPSNTATGKDADDANQHVDLVGYFSRRADDMASTLSQYETHIREIEAHLRTMEAGTMEKAQQLAGNRSAPRDQRKQLSEALVAIDGAIKDTAVKITSTREEVIKTTMGSAGARLL